MIKTIADLRSFTLKLQLIEGTTADVVQLTIF